MKKGIKRTTKTTPKLNKMAVSTYLSIITLDVKKLKGSIKGQRVAEYIQKQDPSVCCQQETHFISKDTQIESKRREKGISCKWKWKRLEYQYLLPDKIDFKTNIVTRDEKGHYIIIKESIQQEDIIIVNICSLNTGTPKYINMNKHKGKN